jgi:nitrate reductase NapE component
VPLPFSVPAVSYSAPFAVATPVPDSIFPIGGRLDEPPRSLAAAQALWAAWSSASVPRRAENGFMIFAAVGGAFKSLQELSLGESETHKAEVAAEKSRREREARLRQEEEERLRREREEAERLRLLGIEERRRREEELYQRNKAERRRRFWKRVFLGIKIILAILVLLFIGRLGFVAWNYQEKHPEIWNFLQKIPFMPENNSTPPKQAKPAVPSDGASSGNTKLQLGDKQKSGSSSQPETQ